MKYKKLLDQYEQEIEKQTKRLNNDLKRFRKENKIKKKYENILINFLFNYLYKMNNDINYYNCLKENKEEILKMTNRKDHNIKFNKKMDKILK